MVHVMARWGLDLVFKGELENTFRKPIMDLVRKLA
jgi:hypothetical protein